MGQKVFVPAVVFAKKPTAGTRHKGARGVADGLIWRHSDAVPCLSFNKALIQSRRMGRLKLFNMNAVYDQIPRFHVDIIAFPLRGAD